MTDNSSPQQQTSDNSDILEMPEKEIVKHPMLRWLLILLGGVMVLLGLIGVVVPGLPTTVFLIVAAWAFSKSSIRFQHWLWHHKFFGPPVRSWHYYRAIPKKAKIFAVLMMFTSVCIVAYRSYSQDSDWDLMIFLCVIFVPVATYICTRPYVPKTTVSGSP